MRFAEERTMSVSVVDNRVVCPQCGCAVTLLRITRAASLVDVSRRTIYSYIENGSVYAVKVAGKTLRVCSSCLLDRGSQAERRGVIHAGGIAQDRPAKRPPRG